MTPLTFPLAEGEKKQSDSCDSLYLFFLSFDFLLLETFKDLFLNVSAVDASNLTAIFG